MQIRLQKLTVDRKKWTQRSSIEYKVTVNNFSLLFYQEIVCLKMNDRIPAREDQLKVTFLFCSDGYNKAAQCSATSNWDTVLLARLEGLISRSLAKHIT